MPRTGWGFLGLVVTFGALLFGGWMMFSFLGRATGREGGGLPLLAEFRVVDTTVNDSCSTPLDYCIRVACIVKNEGLVSGTADVTFTVTRSGASPILRRERVSIASGDREVVQHDFREVGLFDGRVRGSCDVR